jgi:ADP-heptose:LPS heptosyltransferase
VLLLWGPGERQVVERVRDAMRSNAIVLPPTDLNELAAMVARLDLVIAHDSGVRHVAVARATPSLCLYGPTDPRNWQPRFGPHAGIRAAVPCLGCNLTRCTHHLCMARLRPEAVAERALAMLESRSACGS